MLDQEQVDKLKMLFSMAGWNEVMKPAIENRFRQRTKLLIQHPSERVEADRDDGAIRSELKTLEWLLVAFQNEITVFESNQRVDELARTEAQDELTPANP